MGTSSNGFYAKLAAVLNSEQSRSVIVSGNVYDLFNAGDEFLPLIPYLTHKSKTEGLIRIVYELNGPIRILDDRDKLKNSWISWKAGVDLDTLLVKGLKQKRPLGAGATWSQVRQALNRRNRPTFTRLGDPSPADDLLAIGSAHRESDDLC